jgi:hypothetical protein
MDLVSARRKNGQRVVKRLAGLIFASAATVSVTQKPTPLKIRGSITIVTKFFFYESVR